MKLVYFYTPEQVRIIPEGQGTLTESITAMFERAEEQALNTEENNHEVY